MKDSNLIFDPSAIALDCATLLEQMPCAIGIKSTDSVYVTANQQVAELTGFSSAKQMIGIQDKDLHCAAADLSALFTQQDQEALTSNTVANLDICRYSDNQLHVFLSVKKKITDQKQQSFVLFTMTELPILAVSKIMSILSHSSMISAKELASSYRVSEANAQANVSLTKRLNEVLFLLAHGKSIKAVAHTLNISPKTAEEHINRLKEHFECYTKSQLIEKAFALGYAYIIPPSLLNMS